MIAAAGRSVPPADEPVLLEREGGVAVITLNRPRQRNAMTPVLLDGFSNALDRLEADGAARCLVVTGAGSAFCAGGDMDLMRDLANHSPVDALERLGVLYPPFLRLLRMGIPSIAAVNGPAIGGGLGLALLCDLRVASADATFGAPFGKLGFPPGMAITYLLPRVVGHANALDLLLTSRTVDAATAARMGMVGEVVAADDLPETARRLAESVASHAPAAVRVMRDELLSDVRAAAPAALRRELREQALAVSTGDYLEGLTAAAARRRPRFSGR